MRDQKLIVTKLNHAVTAHRTRILTVLSEDGRLAEIYAEPTADSLRIGSIYIGKVKKIVPNIRAAFVDITPGQSTYLSLEHTEHCHLIRKHGSSGKIAEGDELLVQIQKDAKGGKVPSVTTNLSLAGEYLVLTTGDHKLGVSGKIDPENRRRLKAAAESMPRKDYGIIIRTNACFAGEEELEKERVQLERILSALIRHSETRSCYSCLYQGIPQYMRLMHSVRFDRVAEIVTDLPEIFQELTDEQKNHQSPLPPVRLYEDSYPLASAVGLAAQLEKALRKKVWLKSGGSLIIEPTEALTVIDVNTGKSISGKQSKELNYQKTNQEAALEIARQIRLRNLSGIILIDFINMKSEEANHALLRQMQMLLREDPVPARVIDRTALGLVEITRKKISKCLSDQLTSD
jgi:ribonuclease G